jgi:hypothetical protein
MKQQIFSIYDEKSEAYNTPFFQNHINQAIRSFSDLSKDPKTTISRHPQDFSLYHIGEYDDVNSSIQSFNEPKFLARATEFNNTITPTEVGANENLNQVQSQR